MHKLTNTCHFFNWMSFKWGPFKFLPDRRKCFDFSLTFKRNPVDTCFFPSILFLFSSHLLFRPLSWGYDITLLCGRLMLSDINDLQVCFFFCRWRVEFDHQSRAFFLSWTATDHLVAQLTL